MVIAEVDLGDLEPVALLIRSIQNSFQLGIEGRNAVGAQGNIVHIGRALRVHTRGLGLKKTGSLLDSIEYNCPLLRACVSMDFQPQLAKFRNRIPLI